MLLHNATLNNYYLITSVLILYLLLYYLELSTYILKRLNVCFRSRRHLTLYRRIFEICLQK